MESPTHSPFKMPSAPGTPLRQLSAEQMNQQRMLPQSPSLHSYFSENVPSPHRSHRPRDSISSVVQEKVAFLNSLNNSPTRSSPIRTTDLPSSPSKRDAVQRANLAYEESQNSLAAMSTEVQRLQALVNGREKQLNMTANRIDKLTDMLTSEKQEAENVRKNYVHEVKKIRKQCFQAEKLQLEISEELREAKKDLKRKESELASERQKKDEARQEAFERAYTLAGMTEEMEVLREKLRVIEQEREVAVLEMRSNAVRWAGRLEKEASSASMRAHEMVRKASQSEELGEDEATPRPAKRGRLEKSDHMCSQSASVVERPFFSDFVEDRAGEKEFDGETFTLEDHIEQLYREVAYYKSKLSESKETVNLLHMECQFQNCECRRAEKKGKRFIHDHEYEMQMQQQHAAKRRRIEEDEKANTLPPVPAPEQIAQEAEDATMEEAMHIPLPEPTTQKLDSRDCTPEVTAVLEEMTQVLVEPLASAANSKFTFSTSTSARPPHLARAETAMAASTETDLFDMSPPKHYPPRPSTALGVMTRGLNSPIRLVPDSPQLETIYRSSTPLDEPPSHRSTTTRVALKDASPTRSPPPRSQSRPNIRSRSRPRSPLAPTKSNPDFAKSTSASPANNTVFPITPKTKPTQARPQTHHHIPTLANSQMFTTTTTVPLRDEEDDFSHDQYHNNTDFPHTPASLTRAQTQPINIPLSASTSNSLMLEEAQQLNVPGTPISREVALAQIRARRDRARSLTMKNQNGLKSAPGSAKRGITLRDVTNGAGLRGDNREVSVASMASAPGRFG